MPKPSADPPRRIRRILGLECSKYKAFKMYQVLKHYKKGCSKRARKTWMLERMASLVDEITDAEKDVVIGWMLSKSRNFQEALNRLTESFQHDFEEDSDLEVPAPSDLLLIPQLAGAVSLPESECSVCMDLFPRHSFPVNNTTESCDHEVMVCTACTRQSVETQMVDQPTERISCPECPQLLMLDTIRMFSSADAFDRYSMKGFKESLEKMDGYVKCLAPNCASGQLHESGNDQPIVTCTDCGFKTCYTHMMPWHADQTCAQYDEEQRVRYEQEEASKRIVAETSKCCPNLNCGYFIQKSGGCDHMTCQRCHHEFCWLCMAPFAEIRKLGNESHEDTCRYYAPYRPSWVQAFGRHQPFRAAPTL